MSQENTRELSLSQALVYKKRLVAEMSQIESELSQVNCQITRRELYPSEGNIPRVVEYNYDEEKPEKLYRKYLELSRALVELKLDMWRASEPIRSRLLKMSEHKSFIAKVLKPLSLNGEKTGKHVEYDDNVSYYAVFLDKEECQTKKKDLEKEIDFLQSEVDEFNHKTKITIRVVDPGLIY